MKNMITVGLASLLFISSCRESSSVVVPSHPPSRRLELRSTMECENKISIWLEGKKQFRATIESDIPLYEGVEFSGYYEKGDLFIRLVGLDGNQIILTKDGDKYFKTDISISDAVTQGWKMDSIPHNASEVNSNSQ